MFADYSDARRLGGLSNAGILPAVSDASRVRYKMLILANDFKTNSRAGRTRYCNRDDCVTFYVKGHHSLEIRTRQLAVGFVVLFDYDVYFFDTENVV